MILTKAHQSELLKKTPLDCASAAREIVGRLPQKSIDRSGEWCYNKIIKRGRQERMYESDKVIGTDIREAIKWIEAKDLWDEVIDLESDATGIVTAVIH